MVMLTVAGTGKGKQNNGKGGWGSNDWNKPKQGKGDWSKGPGQSVMPR